MRALEDKDVTMVVCGELHTAALTSEGRVYTWGLGKDGRLGHANRESHFVPHLVQSLAQYEVKQAGQGVPIPRMRAHL